MPPKPSGSCPASTRNAPAPSAGFPATASSIRISSRWRTRAPRAYDAWVLPSGFSMREVERDWDVFLHHVVDLLPWFPLMENAEMVGAMAGLTTYPPDGQWVLGRVPHVDGFLVASGCSGLGVT